MPVNAVAQVNDLPGNMQGNVGHVQPSRLQDPRKQGKRGKEKGENRGESMREEGIPRYKNTD